MNVKEARALVDSREKLDPNYVKAVKVCIEDDKVEVEPEAKSSPKKKAK